MRSLDKDEKEDRENKDGEYLLTYSQHLEKRIRNLETESQLLKAETIRLERELRSLTNEINQLRQPSLITGTLVDVLDDNNERVIIKSSTGPNFVVKTSKYVKNEKLSPGMSVALNQSTFAVMEILPANLDPFIKGMELIDTIPDTSYNDIGGLEEQIQEVKETVELPLIKPELFKRIGIEPPKGVLLYGPPGTGKTLLAKAVAHETKSTFIRVIGSELVQKFIGEGARYVREIFELARTKSPTILLIDELDAIAALRMEDSTSGDREVQRTMMQLLSELDGFDERGEVKIIGATNRIDILDPALLRPGRFDRIIEFPIPNEKARKEIFKVHMRSLNIEQNVDLNELIKLTEYATGADIKAICTEAGMFAIRNDSEIISQNDFIESIFKVLKKRSGFHPESGLFI